MNKRIIVLLFAALFLLASCASLQKKEIATPEPTVAAANTDASINIKLKSGEEDLAKVLHNLNKVYGTPRFKVDLSRTPSGDYIIVEKLYYQIKGTNSVVIVSTMDSIITSIDTVNFNTTTLPLIPKKEAKLEPK
jgi:hypothetical protein